MPKIHRNQADKSIINDKQFVFEQAVSSNLWVIQHNLNKKPSITVVDEYDRVIECQKEYLDENTIVLTFNAAFKGCAYLN